MKRRNFFALLFAAAGMPVLAKKIKALPIKTYTGTLRTFGPNCPVGLPGPPGLTRIDPLPTTGGQVYLNGDGAWKTLSSYKTGDVVRYMDGREYRCFNS